MVSRIFPPLSVQVGVLDLPNLSRTPEIVGACLILFLTGWLSGMKNQWHTKFYIFNTHFLLIGWLEHPFLIGTTSWSGPLFEKPFSAFWPSFQAIRSTNTASGTIRWDMRGGGGPGTWNAYMYIHLDSRYIHASLHVYTHLTTHFQHLAGIHFHPAPRGVLHAGVLFFSTS